MNKKIRFFAEQVLIVSNIFIAFLLLFESKLVVPAWLQPVGRMHPLILHFPIVILILAIVMQWLRSSPSLRSNHFYGQLSRTLLLSGVLLAAVTVVMGIFLSKEEGYSGSTLQWHKWTGAFIFFFASVLYWIGNKQWYKGMVATSAGLVVVAALIVTGHYGANLTHGEDFILQPLAVYKTKPVVPIDQAMVFEHVIQPIFESKCISCHNSEKLKGELMLIDSASIVKGGKTGKLFVPGNPDLSLLLERVHLPLEEKKHMPPKGKAQLTEAEVTLLALWIKAEAPFAQKVTAFPAGDSLRIMATAILQPTEPEEEHYTFSAADEQTIAQLNTDYRTISPLAKESPALAVNVYNREAYTPKQLEELGPIRKQIVALNLNKLPVKDEDLKTIAQFENLRKLDLNFTDISTKGLQTLRSLSNLHTLSVSGTSINYQDLAALIPSVKTLARVSVWETQISPAEAEQLQKKYPGVNFIKGFTDDGTNPLKLNPPQVKNSSVVFDQPLALQLMHPIKGVQIHYTLDGSEPDSITSPLFDNTTVLKESTTIKAKAYKQGWYASDVVEFDFFKSTYKPDSVRILLPLNNVHQAEGEQTFFNTKLGAIGANNPAWANNWAGVRNNDMVLVFEFKQPIMLSSVGLHYMVEETTGIFPPASVEVWGGEDENRLKLLVTMKPPVPAKGEEPSLKRVEQPFKPQAVSRVKIVAKRFEEKDKRRLLLVDEMFLN